ncbi:MAG: hypothetical protein ACK4UO_13005 [Pseudolabrys sp.]
MTKNKKSFVGPIAAVGLLALLALGTYLLSQPSAAPNQGTLYDAIDHWFGNGFQAGLLQQLSVDSNGALTQTATTTEGSLACKTFSGSFADATTTLAAVQNPFAATSTVVFTNANVSGVSTSTMSLEIGTTTANTTAPTDTTKVSGSLATLTIATGTQAYITSGIGATGIPVGGTAYGGTASMIQLAPTDVVAIYASSTNANADNGGILGRTNTFAGSYNFRICR